MRHSSANSTVGEIRTPETILLSAERARFREEVLTQALAAVESAYLRLILYARYQLSWSFEMIAQEFQIQPMAAWRAHNCALEIMRKHLAERDVKDLSDLL